MEEIGRHSKSASYSLQSANNNQKSAALLRIHEYLAKRKEDILLANAKDLQIAKEKVADGSMSAALFKRLDLNGVDGQKYDQLLQGVLDVEKLHDPTGKVTLATQLDDGLDLYRVSCPVGVLLIIFEARPEVVVQISCLAIKSGNAVILKGGKEAHHSNQVLFETLQAALASLSNDDGSGDYSLIPPSSIQLVSSRNDIAELLQMDNYIDLVIPRGSNQLVRYVQDSTRIPVLGHADGICSIYIAPDALLEKTISIVVDSKANYPAACNSTEKLLVDSACANQLLPSLAKRLIEVGVKLLADERALKCLTTGVAEDIINSDMLQPAGPDAFVIEHLDLVLSLKIVDSFDEAVQHINTYGSHHTDCIITEDSSLAERFMKRVDSAGVYWNASTRFADGFRYGFGAEIGVSTNKTHARGPVGLEGLVIYKYRLYGRGHAVGWFSNKGDENGRVHNYKHSPLPLFLKKH